MVFILNLNFCVLNRKGVKSLAKFRVNPYCQECGKEARAKKRRLNISIDEFKKDFRG